ncbi:MAG: glycosyltransferase [bacterium]|nr:glycosyltransferase [bacterium]
MRICYIGDGGSVHNQFMIEWFAARGHDILFLTDVLPPHPWPCETVQVASRESGGFWRHRKATHRVKKEIRRWKPDVVHAHNVTGYGYWGAGCGFHPFVLTAWGSDLLIVSHRNALVRMWVRSTLRKADLITADAVSLCETAQEEAKRKIDARLLQWGIDFSEFENPPGGALRDRVRAGADYVFVSNRRLRPIYNIDIIIRAFARALPRVRGSRLVVIGDDEMREQLERLVEMLGLHEHVEFTGWLKRKDMIGVLQSADCYISVPSSDSTPLSLLEAFSARLPVIVSDLPAMHEWVTQGESGMIVRSNHEALLTQAMIHLAQNPDQGKTWGEKNRRLAEERANRDAEMNKLLGWYQSLIGTK